MDLIKELGLITEASHAQRAWSGKIDRIDALLRWMYDKDILTKTEKAKKDSLFNAYYRYYNDGDFPRVLSNLGIRKWHADETKEQALEGVIDTFIKSILTKYWPKIDRSEFRLDTAIQNISTPIYVANEGDVTALLNYWIKQVKIADDTKLKELISVLEEKFGKLKAAVDENPEAKKVVSNLVTTYWQERLSEKDLWTPKLEKLWKQTLEASKNIAVFLKDLQESLKKLKKQNIVVDAELKEAVQDKTPEELDKREKMMDRIEGYFGTLETLEWSKMSTEDYETIYNRLLEDGLIKPMK